MSWDLFVQDWGKVESLDEIPDDFSPKSIGKRSDIITTIKKAEPTVDFTDPSYGKLKNEHFSIKFNMGDEEELMSFMLIVRGSELAIPCIANILDKLELKAADGSDTKFFDIDSGKDKIIEWMNYRNKILNK